MSGLSCKPLCIIPARAGSKRLLRKNLTMLGGKPLLAWTIEKAIKASIFDNVWVSSEDHEILTACLMAEDNCRISRIGDSGLRRR